MKITTHLLLIAALLCAASFAGCDDDEENTTTDTGTSGTSGTDATSGTDGTSGTDATATTSGTDTTDNDTSDPPPPPPPTLGAQIERMGRPAVNTALNHTFDADQAAKDSAKDAWNEAAQSAWPTFVPEIAANLAILDSLDTVCGNQLLAGETLDATRYTTLATVLADDRLWVKVDATECGVYLAVEANATNLLPNTNCGGRQPAYDVIDATYSAVAVGSLSGVGDTISAASGQTGSATFPYLAPPQ